MLRDCKMAVTAFDWVPDFAQGHVRDLRVRWALEEAGLPYDIDLLRQGSQKDAQNLTRQPFGQVPSLTMDEGSMFESGAIVWRIAQETEALLSGDRDEVLSWLFAALNTVEPPISMVAMLDLFIPEPEANAKVRPHVLAGVEARLGTVERQLSDRDYLTGRFTVADLIMTTVLRDVRGIDTAAKFPRVAAYVARCTARPAFRKALADQMRPFADNAALYARQA